ncbi:MAG: hypothetical protein JSW10_06195 [Pseudomonadota bacterium]|nr:MAG: hypothetical protein JSW10_06195 [Pseudomonadota bacterium]
MPCCVTSLAALGTVAAMLLGGCATAPLSPYSEDGPPLALVPAAQVGVQDKRGRFREIFCAVLEERGETLPDYRPCGDALTQVGTESGATGESVELGMSKRRLIAAVVPGIGWDCFDTWLAAKGTTAGHVRQYGYDLIPISVDGLSSSANNARQIRDAVMQMEGVGAQPRLVLIGYSKGAPDILEAVVSYPEIRERVAAVISASGAVGGSPLVNDATQSQLALMRHWPGAKCTPGDGGAIESLRPSTRRQWLAENPLPDDFPYYSLVSHPEPERISSVLRSSYNKLSRIDARNDSQVLFYDQVIPGSTLVAYVNADHWALAVPIARTHATLGSTFVDKNDFPREALLEAMLRFVEEDLDRSAKAR